MPQVVVNPGSARQLQLVLKMTCLHLSQIKDDIREAALKLLFSLI
jgi:hypothetical protein